MPLVFETTSTWYPKTPCSSIRASRYNHINVFCKSRYKPVLRPQRVVPFASRASGLRRKGGKRPCSNTIRVAHFSWHYNVEFPWSVRMLYESRGLYCNSCRLGSFLRILEKPIICTLDRLHPATPFHNHLFQDRIRPDTRP